MISRYVQVLFTSALLIVGSLLANTAFAATYVNFDEHFTTNFGDPEKPKLSYLRVNIAMKVADDNVKTQVGNHKPYIRDLIIRQLVRQDVATVRTSEAKTQLRADILSSVKAFLMEEEGEELVEDVMFTEFIVQE
jgi:flagellar FliL protein